MSFQLFKSQKKIPAPIKELSEKEKKKQELEVLKARHEAKNKIPRQRFSLLPKASKEIFKSWLLWRIILAVTLSILAIQAITLVFSAKHMQQSALNDLEKAAHATISVAIDHNDNLENTDEHAPLFSKNIAQEIIKNSNILGISVYEKPSISHNISLTLTEQYGQTIDMPYIAITDPGAKNYNNTQYEFSFHNIKAASNHIIAVKADSSEITSQVMSYILLHGIKDISLTGIVMLIIIFTISHWLLDPILFMRSNLIEASKNPDNPKIPKSPYKDDNEIGNAIAIAQDLIKNNFQNLQRTKSSAENKIYKLAFFDNLTKLPNQAFFLQQVERAMMPKLGQPAKPFHIITVDLDNFQDINDSMGHNVGDLILRNVGKRLQAALNEHVIISRSGEDEFTLMIKEHSRKSSEELAHEVLQIIRTEPFIVFNEKLHVKASAGLATFPEHGQEAEQLIKHADIALNKAKEDGRNTFKKYSINFEKAIHERFQLLSDLRKAMDNEELVLFYQPQLDLRSGRVIGAEALIRWWKANPNEPNGGHYISPGAFIPAAEKSGLIVPIGEWIIEQAIKDAKLWNETYGFDMRVAINISGAQFEETDLTALTKHMLEKYDLPAHKVELEVTESVFMDDIDQTVAVLQSLYDLGVELAIDDFGTGYSSLSYLSRFPIHRLKVDQAFVKNALENQNDASITRTIITLGHALNLQVIAEGVETLEHEQFLIEQDCDEVQGFRYSKPLPNARFIEFCKEYNGDLRSFAQI